jgi:hypothetical protein
MAVDPTAGEQELLQLVNRFRTDPQGEFVRLFSVQSPLKARDPILQVDLDFARVDGNALKSQLQAISRLPPLAWNDALATFSKSHNAAMLAKNPPQQFHSDTLQRRTALLNAGVDLRIVQGEKINSENVYGYGKSPLHTFAALVVDWQRGGPSGMASGAPHRTALSNADYDQIGHAITNFAGANFGPQVTTQVLANIQNPPAMVVGALFQDKNNSRWYEAGEGIAGATIVFEGSAGTFSTKALSAGGYQIALPAGTYKVTANGGGMKVPVVANGITVGNSNVWQNLIYDPSVIPPDRLESNNTLASATTLTGVDQALSGLSIHTATDVDYFRITSRGNGPATFTIQFSHANGNLDLRLLDAAGKTLASSSSTSNQETINANLVRNGSYYVQVLSAAGATNAAYSLSIVAPKPAPPEANDDWGAVNSTSPTITLDVIANDIDPDGNASQLVPKLIPGTHSAFQIVSGKVHYTAPVGYSGIHRANYTVKDDQQLESNRGVIDIFVVDFSRNLPWINSDLPTDVNDDGQVTPIDVLLIINRINARAFGDEGTLPKNSAEQGDLWSFVDASGDGRLSALDALLVINRLNGLPNSGGESSSSSIELDYASNDLAMAQLMGPYLGSFEGDERRRRQASELVGFREELPLQRYL